MKRYPILVLAYRRVDELQATLDALEQLNPSIVYFHIHDAPNEEHQKKVNSVKKLISLYDKPKEVKYSKEPLGVRTSLYSALEWISSKEEVFFVFEDDIVLKPKSLSSIQKLMDRLEKEDGLVKFGEHREHSVYWGWATTSKTAKIIIKDSILEIDEEIAIPHFQNKLHYKAVMELYRRQMTLAWDDEFGFICKILGVNVILSKETLTTHIGVFSTRINNGLDTTFGKNTHVTFRNGVLVPQENDNA